MRSFWTTAYALLCLSLSACSGGGGGDSGGGGGSSSTRDGAFTLSGNSASFTAIQDGTAPPNTSLALTVTGKNVTYVGAAYTNGQTQPSWLNINIVGSGNNYQVVIGVRQIGTPPGQYSSTFGVGTANANGDILQSQMITVSYTVVARVAIASGTYALTFAYGDAQPTGPVSLPVQAPGRTWTASSDVPWLTMPAAAQTGNGPLTATANVSSLEPGTHSGRVTVVDSGHAQNSSSATVTVQVLAPTLSVATTSLVLGGADGLSATTRPLSFNVNSGATGRTLANHTFTVTPTTDAGGNWLRPNVTSGAIGPAGVAVDINGARGSLAGGTYTGQLALNVTVKNLVLSRLVPVTYNIEESRIIVGATGVGLSSSPAPARSVLTRSVPVFSSLGRTNVPWQASSDRNWLNVSSSGVTGQSITLTANPSGLATDQTHFATVTVTSTDPLVENQETIRVGLRLNSTAPSSLGRAVNAQYLVASPVEPLVFINNRGSTITAYDVYTGATVRTFTGNVTEASTMVINGDGRRLYVYDRPNSRVSELDAVTGALIRHYSWTNGSWIPTGDLMTFFRPSGRSILITPDGVMFDVDTGRQYAAQSLEAGELVHSMAVSMDSTMLIDSDTIVNRMRYSALSGGSLRLTSRNQLAYGQGGAGQACITPDLQTVYTANSAPPYFQGNDIATGQIARILPGYYYPNSVLCLWNGVIVGGINGFGELVDVWVYDGPSGQELAQLSSGWNTPSRRLRVRGMAASADATRLITLTRADPSPPYQAEEVRFQSIPGAL
ncbi:hypothetical protein ACFPN2_08785 [Steroidobacter flavus]|uniref:BACON domain-containing protein n=1 Tax=Steroidobacter flavus TaxID=1842136 RepID=A0ABV8SRH9_9GAMM